MLQPLDPNKLRALVCEEENVYRNDVDYHSIRLAKSYFAENDVIQGIYSLLDAFHEQWRPHLYHENSKPERWHIQFPVHASVPHKTQPLNRSQDPPFDTLYLRAKGNSVEIFKHRSYVSAREIREVFKQKTCTASVEMVGCPENWVLMLQWLWAYGDEVYRTNMMNGSMLRPLDHAKLDTLAEDEILGKQKDVASGIEPLDPEKLRALTGDDDNVDCHNIRAAKSFFAKDDLAEGMKSLLRAFDLWSPQLYYDQKTSTSWHIGFQVCAPRRASSNTDFDYRNTPSTPSTSDLVAVLSRYPNMADFSSHSVS